MVGPLPQAQLKRRKPTYGIALFPLRQIVRSSGIARDMKSARNEAPCLAFLQQACIFVKRWLDRQCLCGFTYVHMDDSYHAPSHTLQDQNDHAYASVISHSISACHGSLDTRLCTLPEVSKNTCSNARSHSETGTQSYRSNQTKASFTMCEPCWSRIGARTRS